MIKNFAEYKISKDDLNTIHSFVLNSICTFNELGLQREDLRVLMPEWILFIMQNNISGLNRFSNAVNGFRNNKIFGIEVYPHFKNEIVVYITKFYNNEELYGPKIIEIV
jgi:hypothetical protein